MVMLRITLPIAQLMIVQSLLAYGTAEPFGQGIVNAQLSVLKGLEAAARHGYIFVVPPMVQWWAPHEPSYLLILPFSHFHDAKHFQEYADEQGELAIRHTKSHLYMLYEPPYALDSPPCFTCWHVSQWLSMS